MKISSRYVLIIALLVLSWWLQNLFTTKPELITREKTRSANYFLEDFSLKAHDDQGRVKYILKASRLDNYEDESLAELKTITVEFINNKTSWHLSAGNATLFHDSNKIDFFNGVTIKRPEQSKQTGLIITTQQIHLDNDTDFLQTDKEVTLLSDGMRLQSKGLRFDSRKEVLELTSKVKGQYER